MSKACMCIMMLQILNSRKQISVGELADILQTNPRNILEYKKELEDAGYEIETIPGRYGGYSLNRKGIFPSIVLTQEEKQVIYEANDFLAQRYDFLNKRLYAKAMSKIVSSFPNQALDVGVTIVDRFPLAMKQEELEERFTMLNAAVQSKNKIIIKYLSTKNVLKEHKIHPYKTYIYNNAWFVLAWNETINDIGYFKVNRIDSYQVTKETFTVLKTYNEAQYLDRFGMKHNGEFYHIKLQITGAFAGVVKDRIYGKNQQLTSLDENTTILECDMQNKNNIKTFVLGFGSFAQVLEPKWLVDMVKEELQKTLAYYE